MSDRPELPFLAAAGVATVGATMRDGKLPDLTRVAIGTIALVILASMTAETRIAPLVRAFGLLVLLVAVITATNAVIAKSSKKVSKS